MGDSVSATRREPVDRLLTPLQDFLRHEAAGGIVLIACAALWQTKLGVDVAGKGLSKPLLLWINDGLMAVFFFVAGLEIKREVMVGELSSVRRALVPIASAAGGMLVPAAIYTVLNHGGPGARGWGVPMATDIAFAVGVLPFAGRGLPVATPGPRWPRPASCSPRCASATGPECAPLWSTAFSAQGCGSRS